MTTRAVVIIGANQRKKIKRKFWEDEWCGEYVIKTRQREEEVGRQHQGMDGPGVRQVPEGSGERGKMEKTGCKIICGAPTTLAVKGLMMMKQRKEKTAF